MRPGLPRVASASRYFKSPDIRNLSKNAFRWDRRQMITNKPLIFMQLVNQRQINVKTALLWFITPSLHVDGAALMDMTD